MLTDILDKFKDSPLRYYSKEIVEKMQFSIIKNLLENIIFRDNPIFYEFLKKILYLYKKITIGSKTMFMDKYKIKDLINYSPLLRKILFMTNSTLFTEASEQISFFIETLSNLLEQDINCPEIFDVVIEICGILKRLSGFYLFNNTKMELFCIAIEKIFILKKFKNSNEKQYILFIIIMIIHFMNIFSKKK